MRVSTSPNRRLSALIALTVSTLVAAPAWSQARPPAKAPPAKAAPAPQAVPEPPPKSSEPVRTSEQIKRGSVEGAVTAPLRDLNVVKAEIPDILLEAVENPYAKPPAKWRCPQLAALIRPLDEALGPDIDRLPPEDENLRNRGKSTALGAAADMASGAIPFRGVVRQITGAASHDKRVQAAIIAGNVRRAYLKGLGEARGCPAAAIPSSERRLATQAAAKPQSPPAAAAPRTRTETPATAPRKSRS